MAEPRTPSGLNAAVTALLATLKPVLDTATVVGPHIEYSAKAARVIGYVAVGTISPKVVDAVRIALAEEPLGQGRLTYACVGGVAGCTGLARSSGPCDSCAAVLVAAERHLFERLEKAARAYVPYDGTPEETALHDALGALQEFRWQHTGGGKTTSEMADAAVRIPPQEATLNSLADRGSEESAVSPTTCAYCGEAEGHSRRCSVSRHGAPEDRSANGWPLSDGTVAALLGELLPLLPSAVEGGWKAGHSDPEVFPIADRLRTALSARQPLADAKDVLVCDVCGEEDGKQRIYGALRDAAKNALDHYCRHGGKDLAFESLMRALETAVHRSPHPLNEEKK